MTSMIQATGPITIENVRAALSDTDPSTTNSGALRLLIGRGSMATIQKHLDTIRAEHAPAPATPGAAPAAPTDLVAALWAAAYNAAQVQTLGRIDALTMERDAALARVTTQAHDVAALAASVDTLTEQAQAAQAAVTLAQAATQAAQAATVAAQAELDKVRGDMERVTEAATAAAALAARDAQIERQALQTTIDRLTDQASELKSLLARLSPPVSEVK